jgi:16S rRNA processing protein RimM
VQNARLQREQLTLALEGIDAPDQAKLLVGCSVYLPLAALPDLGDKRFYFHEIKGFEVIDERFGVVGVAEEVLDRLMQPVLRVLNGRNEVLLPLPEGAVKKVDRAAKKLYLTSPEGLIELYLPQTEEPE